MRILLVEDDPLLGEGLRTGLGAAGFTVDWIGDGPLADAALATERYAAVVLDWRLPRGDGLGVLRALRARRDVTPVLMLTARDAVEDRIAGLDAGADDYLVKPFALGELAARLRALVRRAAGEASQELRAGPLLLDVAAHRASLDGRPLDLSAREFALLHLLMSQRGRPATRQRLESALYGWGEEVNSNSIEVHIHNLRRKLGGDAIKTIRGVGYLINPDYR